MPNYIINKNPNTNGLHEVHISTGANACEHLPERENMAPLGSHVSSKYALAEAKRRGFETPDGCSHCCEESHKE